MEARGGWVASRRVPPGSGSQGWMGLGEGIGGGWVAALFCPQACRKTTRLRLAAAKSLRRAWLRTTRKGTMSCGRPLARSWSQVRSASTVPS